uniref:ABC transporter substrate-binding protein n=1 Tax=Roseihalotalea indica TaxID=2867963 RepID=A0AA49JGA1_9BACT|nr:ABC transporter substrate-binding protein [Tunicatimonas sp. TK19036]
MAIIFHFLRDSRWAFLSFHPPINWLIGLGVSLLCLRCGTPQSTENNGTVTSDTSLTWKPLDIRYAQGFTIEYHSDYKTLLLYQPSDTLRYLLLPPNSPLPPEKSYDQVIHIPVKRVITQSTTHLALMRFLDAEDAIVGLDNADYVYDSIIAKRVEEGIIQEVGSGTSLNTERVIALQPDLLLVSRMPGSSLDPYQKFIAMGIPVIPNAEWMEPTPLGKAEWVKLMAALLNREEQAASRFTEVQHAYDSLIQIAQQAQQTPEVVVGSPFQGSWYVPGGNSYRGSLLRHAQAGWPWSQDTSAVSFPIAFERIYAFGLQAPYWLDPGQAHSKAELLAIDTRFADFKAFRQNRIYNSNRRLNPGGGGNDYYESGAVYPQRVLADLIKILHPELLPEHELYYYQRLP